MINKIYKSIHNKYLNFFKLFFFLRYIFVIFLISTISFLLIPKFFDYKKKDEIIINYLIENYDLEIIEYSEIEYRIFPIPNLLIKNVNSKIADRVIDLKIAKINIFLNLRNLYNYDNFYPKRTTLETSEMLLDIKKINELINYVKKIKKEIAIKNLDLTLTSRKVLLLKIQNTNFYNYGFKKDHLNGKIFGKTFKASFEDNQFFNFKLLNTGIEANIKFNEENLSLINGISKIKILNSLLKFDFSLNDDKLIISNSNFRNQDLLISLDSNIAYSPFFNSSSVINIIDFDQDLIIKFNLEKIYSYREILKKLNSKININYKNKNLFKGVIDNYYFDLDLIYGRLFFSNKFIITGGEIECSGDSVIIDQYPRLNFSCKLGIENKKKLFKKFHINKKIEHETLNLISEGSLNIIKNKINFKMIEIDNKIYSNEDDLEYFKIKIEEILFDDGFFGILDKDKIKNFLLEIT